MGLITRIKSKKALADSNITLPTSISAGLMEYGDMKIAIITVKHHDKILCRYAVPKENLDMMITHLQEIKMQLDH